MNYVLKLRFKITQTHNNTFPKKYSMKKETNK